ncbi:unnamed protein product, partial [Protopolystoma xenopodis]
TADSSALATRLNLITKRQQQKQQQQKQFQQRRRAQKQGMLQTVTLASRRLNSSCAELISNPSDLSLAHHQWLSPILRRPLRQPLSQSSQLTSASLEVVPDHSPPGSSGRANCRASQSVALSTRHVTGCSSALCRQGQSPRSPKKPQSSTTLLNDQMASTCRRLRSPIKRYPAVASARPSLGLTNGVIRGIESLRRRPGRSRPHLGSTGHRRVGFVEQADGEASSGTASSSEDDDVEEEEMDDEVELVEDEESLVAGMDRGFEVGTRRLRNRSNVTQDSSVVWLTGHESS